MDTTLYRQVTFNDDFDCVADLNTEPIYLKLVRNIDEISDELKLISKELNDKPSEKRPVAEYNQQELWGSTVDKLPDFGIRVTVCIDGTYVRDGKLTGYGWFIYDSVGLIEVSKANKVTHWMPLPQPPTQVNQ